MKTMKTLALLLATLAVGNSAQAQTAITLPPNRSYTFTGSAASGSGTITYQWYRNGVAISGATSQNYTMPANLASGAGVEIKRGTTSSTCPNQVTYSNIYNISFCGLVVGSTCWASENTAGSNAFGSRTDEYSPFFQWNRIMAWASTGAISGWNSSPNTSSTWTANPCPSGWRLPTRAEFTALHNAGTTWVDAGVRGATVAGRFYGSGSASCTISSITNCVFLPAVGYRHGVTGVLGSQGSNGYYWSATENNSSSGGRLAFTSTASGPDSNGEKEGGFSVRCVQ